MALFTSQNNPSSQPVSSRGTLVDSSLSSLSSSRNRKLPDIPPTELPVRTTSLDPPRSPGMSGSRSQTLDSYTPPQRHDSESATKTVYSSSADSTSSPNARDPASSQAKCRSKPTQLPTSSSLSSAFSPLSSISSPSSDGGVSPRPRGSSPRRNLPSDDMLSSSVGMPHSLGSSSPFYAPLNLSASLGISSSRKSSSGSADRDHIGPLDFKRLLSRPAVHKASSSSAVSLPSDSELSGSSHMLSHSGSDVATRSVMHNVASTSSRETWTLQVGPSASTSSANQLPRAVSPTVRDAERERNLSPKPSRNVLRRRPSARSTSATSPPPSRGEGAEYSLDTLPRSASRKQNLRPDDGSPSVARRPATAPHETAPTSGTTARTKDTPIPAGLTPAGRVAHAYKQQEQRREELAEMTGYDDGRRPASAQNSSGRTDQRPDKLDQEEKESSKGPYYTVFGGMPEHRLATDDTWVYNPYPSMGEHATKTHPSPGMRKSLSRKVSGRFKKVADIVKRDRDVSPSRVIHEGHQTRGRDTDSWRPYDGQPLKRRSDSIPKSPRTHMRMSIDDYVDVSTHGKHSRLLIPTAKNGAPETVTEEGRGSGEMGMRASRSGKGKDRDRDRDEDSSPGGKWWKLVKRISTGGLRDKYRQRDSSPPPVPALPQGLQKRALPRMTLEIPLKSTTTQDSSEDGVLLTRFMRSRTSLSGVQATPSSHKHKVSPGSRPSTGNKSATPAAGRPSTTTRSSSPMSSDITSSGFFHRTHSTRSSTSSYGEELPPVPNPYNPTYGQHIISPSELNRMNTEQERNKADVTQKPRTPNRSRSAPVNDERFASPVNDSPPSLPFPPRRRAPLGPSREMSSSPTILSFSTEDPENNFFSPSLPFSSLSEFGTLGPSSAPPPPRPKRSDQRKPARVDVMTIAKSMQAASAPVTPRPHPAISVEVNASNRSSVSRSSYASTAKQVPPSPASSASPSGATRSPLTFRELESPRQAWTEQEKASKWDDLLERSERAGGTLHLSESGLLSEEISTTPEYSESES